MIIGIIASADVAESEFVSNTSVLDFLAQEYSHFGATIAVEDFLSDPSRVDATFGLEMDADGSFMDLEFIGAVAARVCEANFTVIIDWNADGALNPNMGGFTFIDALSANLLSDTMVFSAGAMYPEAYDEHGLVDENPFASRNIFADDPVAVGVPHRIVYTRTPTHLAFSIDGGAVVSSDDTVAGLVLERVFVAYADGSWTGTPGYITRMEFIPPADDAEMPALSTL